MRLIDADALMEQFEETHQFYLFSWGGDFSKMPIRWKAACDELVNCIAEVVNTPTVDAVPRWIPCEDRLPKVGKEVLCQCRANIIEVLFLEESGSWENPSSFRHYLNSFVIAWMPLPEPYGGERSE